MIAQFPQPQNDELLGSILARFIKRQGIRDDKVALDILFKNRKVVPSPLLQGHISELHANVGHLWEVQPAEIIERHTLLPLFKPFVPAERYNDLQNNLIEEALNTGSLRTGMNASILKWPDQYRICSSCWQQQLLRHGYNYWQRIFQCPGVETCPEHGGVLDNTGQPMSSDRRHQFSGADRVAAPSVKDVKVEGKLQLLSSMVRQLLDHPQPSVTTQQWSSFYQRLARNTECMVGARISHEKIKQKVLGYWKSEWLDNHGLGLGRNPNWLVALFRKHRRPFTYLQHIVVWLALYPEPILASDIIAEARALTEHCELFHLSRYKQSECDSTKAEYREGWKKILAAESNTTLKGIRQTRQGARLYSWLYRFDNDWLLQHKPSPVKGYINRRVDWAVRDRQLVKQLLSVQAKNCEVLELPRRSRAWFCNQLGVKSLVDKKLSRMPLCTAFFIRYAESIEEYQARRLACTMSRLIQRNEYIRPICEIERLAGLSRQRSRKPAREILRLDIPAWQRPEAVSDKCSSHGDWTDKYQKTV